MIESQADFLKMPGIGSVHAANKPIYRSLVKA